MTSAGQSLRGSVRDARSTLAALKYQQANYLSAASSAMIDHLRTEFWDHGTLKPMSCFKIKSSIFLSISGVIFMYLIVMVQFRISE